MICSIGKPLYPHVSGQIGPLKWRLNYAVKKRNLHLLEHVRARIVALRRSIATTPELP